MDDFVSFFIGVISYLVVNSILNLAGSTGLEIGLKIPYCGDILGIIIAIVLFKVVFYLFNC